MAEVTSEETSGEIRTLFQCKMCDYAGNSKDDIANHFIYTHASIEVIESPVKAKNSQGGAKSRGTPTKTLRASSRLKDASESKEKSVKQTKKAQNKQSTPEKPQTPTLRGRPRSKQSDSDGTQTPTPSGRPQIKQSDLNQTQTPTPSGRPQTKQSDLDGTQTPTPSGRPQSKQSDSDGTQTPTPSGRPQRKRRAPKWMEEAEVEIIGIKNRKTLTPKNIVIKVEVEGNKSGSQQNRKQEEGQQQEEEGVQADEEGTPVDEEGVLADEEGAPADEERAPADEEGAPAAEEGTPVDEEEVVEPITDDVDFNPDDEDEHEEMENARDTSIIDDNNEKVGSSIEDSDEQHLNAEYYRTEEDWVRVLVKNLVPITMIEFNDKVDKAMSEWESKWNIEHDLDMVKCTKPNCGISIYTREESIHESCHMKDYEGFECIYCDERYSWWKLMRKHIAETHKTQTDILRQWKCNLAKSPRVFRTEAALKRHVRRRHIVQEVGKSTLASFALSQLGEDGEPKKRPVGRPKSLKVRPVGRPKTIVVKQDLDEKPPREKRMHVKWMPTCGTCAAVYETTGELDKHIEHHDVVTGTDEPSKISCTECKEYFTADEIREHMKKEHRRVVMPFRCQLCEFSSNRRYDVKKHMYCHESFKRFQCSLCGKMLSTPYNLKIHRLRVHAPDSEKNILCSLCGFKCANRAVLKDHMRHKHDLTMSGHSRLTTSKAEYPTYPCNLCSYVGKKESSLKYHMRIHEEDRPFKCGLCPYASKSKNNLILHVRTHKGMAPHKCPHCDFRGATTLIVKEHMMAKHTKDKPLKCHICDWATCYNGNMWKHMQMHKLKEGIPIPGKPKRATYKGIQYEDKAKRFDKLLPITIDGFEVTPDQEQANVASDVDNTTSRIMSLPITIGEIGDGATIVMVPGIQGQQQDQTVVADEAAEAAQMVSFKPAEPQIGQQETVCFTLDQAQQAVHGSQQQQSQEQEQVMISVSGDDDQNMQQSISSIITSMAASAAANTQPTTSNLTPGNTLIETQLSASEVASHFEDGTIIEITQIATDGEGTALIPEGAIVEKIAPGMSASDIIMKAANMVAAGQISRSSIPSNYQYTFPVATSRETNSANTLPFLAQVATAQESLPEADTMQIVEEMEASVVTSEAASVEDGSQGDEGMGGQGEEGVGGQGEGVQGDEGMVSQGEIVEHFVATMLPMSE